MTKFLKSCICTHCSSPLIKPTTLQCGHCFCFTCAFDYTGRHGTCPECNLPSTMAGSLKANPQMTQIMEKLNDITDTLVHARPFWWREDTNEGDSDMLQDIKKEEEWVGEEEEEEEEDDWGDDDDDEESDDEVREALCHWKYNPSLTLATLAAGRSRSDNAVLRPWPLQRLDGDLRTGKG